jgi:hypothetical protein
MTEREQGFREGVEAAAKIAGSWSISRGQAEDLADAIRKLAPPRPAACHAVYQRRSKGITRVCDLVMGHEGEHRGEPPRPAGEPAPSPAPVARLRELMAKATPRPWTHQGYSFQTGMTHASGVGGFTAGFQDDCSDQQIMQGIPNAALIVAAVNALPALLDVCEAAQAFRVSGVPHHAWVRLWNALDALAALARVQP